MMMEMVSKKILEEFPGYEIHSNGKVFSLKKKEFISGVKHRRGYTCYSLQHISGKRKHTSLHRLLALAFIPNPNNFEVVRHLDDDKDNNQLSNLAWGTIKDNIDDAIRNNVFKIPDNSKRWLVKTPEGFLLEVENLTNFCKKHSLTKQNLHKTYTGERDHHKHYKLVEML